MGAKRRNLPAGGQYNVSAESGESNERFSLSRTRTVRERKSFRTNVPTKKEARAFTQRGTSTFRFCVSGLTCPIVGWTKRVFAHNRAGNYKISAITRWKSFRPPATSERSRLDGEPIIAQIGHSAPSDEILANNFPWYMGSQSPRVVTIYVWIGKDFSFCFCINLCKSSDLAFKTAQFVVTATVNRAIRSVSLRESKRKGQSR